MLAAGTDIVDEQIIVGDLVAALGVVPEPADILDELAVMVDEHVVDGDHALIRVLGGGILLQQFEPPGIERLRIPLDLGEKPIQAGLVGGVGELAVDAGDRLVVRHHQSREILGEVTPLRLTRKQVRKLPHRVLDHLGELDNPWHGCFLPGPCAPSQFPQFRHKIACFSSAV